MEGTFQPMDRNCDSTMLAFEEKKSAFAKGFTLLNQGDNELVKSIDQLKEMIREKEESLAQQEAELVELNNVRTLLESRLDQVRHIRRDEELLRENFCVYQQMQRLLNISQKDLSLAYRTLAFRIEKIERIIADFHEVTLETNKFIEKKLEEIASGTYR